LTRDPIRRFHHADFDPSVLSAAKAGSGLTISVCIPARDEAATVGGIVDCIRRELVDDVALVDEVLVVDDRSTDATAAVAAAAGARVLAAGDILPQLGPGAGKGEALWKSLAASAGDLVAWVDADITDFDSRFVLGLVGPLLLEPDVDFVKACYDRSADGVRGGGRVTELVARPLLALLFPELAGLGQPLAGEYAGRRHVLELVPFVQGYGVDLALLVDLVGDVGAERLAQVDLGTRRHRNRSLDELGPQALAVLQTALRRAGTGLGAVPTSLVRPGLAPVEIDIAERPPLRDVLATRHTPAFDTERQGKGSSGLR
jgi:glucosyl-3-phosphoglycerate synthase